MISFSKNVKKVFAILVFLFSFPVFASAQALNLSVSKSSYSAGDSMLVTVSVQTGGRPINAVSGTITFDSTMMSVTDIRYGSSIVSLWVEKPAVSSNGVITFTGGVPGGFTGVSGTVFSFVGKAKKSGDLSIKSKDVHVLLNDGSGGELSVATKPISISVSEKIPTPPTKKNTPEVVAPEPVEEVVLPKDIVSPEPFVPLVSHHPSIADDAYFVSFSAVDKDSGVARYEVREKPFLLSFGDWKETTSPYVLEYQHWASNVEVKALDQAGNAVVENVSKPFDTMPIVIFVVLLLVFAIYITKRLSYQKPRVIVKRPTRV